MCFLVQPVHSAISVAPTNLGNKSNCDLLFTNNPLVRIAGGLLLNRSMAYGYCQLSAVWDESKPVQVLHARPAEHCDSMQPWLAKSSTGNTLDSAARGQRIKKKLWKPAWFDSSGHTGELVIVFRVLCILWLKTRLDPFVTRLRAVQGAAHACHTGLAHRSPHEPCSFCVTESSPSSRLGPLIQCEIKRPGTHSVIQNPVKGPQSKPLGKPGYGVVSVVLNVSRPEEANDLIERNVRKVSSKRTEIWHVGTRLVRACLLDDLFSISTLDFLFVEPFRDRVAGLNRSVFTIESNCLTMDGSRTSRGRTGPAHKLPRTDLTRASKLPILGWSPRRPQEM